MKLVVVAAAAAVLLAAPASAKFGIAITAGARVPAVGQPVTVAVRSEQPLSYDLRLIAVAPGRDIFRVVATITGDTRRPVPNVARHGFEVELVRVAADRWRGVVRFPSRGKWRVVVPNGAPVGVVLPAGAARLQLDVR